MELYHGLSDQEQSHSLCRQYNLLIIITLIIIQLNIEKPQLINPLRSRNNSQPISQLQSTLAPPSGGHTFCFFKNFFVKYFKYRPENFAPLATTTIFPSSREIVILSPRLPVRLSTLILSCRNFSNAEGSKILSFVGADASRTYYHQPQCVNKGGNFLRLFFGGGFA